MLNLFSTTLPLLGSYLYAQKENAQAQKELQARQNRYDQELRNLNTLFNRSYYSNLLDRSDIRGLLGNLRDQMMMTTETLKNRASISGATPEAVTAAQKVQNQSYGNAVSQVASYATSWKENALQNYLSARNALEELYQPAKSNYKNNILGQTFNNFNFLKKLFN